MKTLIRVIVLFAVLPILARTAAAQPTEAEAIARLRGLYRLVDEEAIVREGLPLILRYPASTELRAWYIAGLGASEPEKATIMARELRYARPDDPWSWVAMSVAQLADYDDSYYEAPKTSARMLELYKGSDPEVFRLHADILRYRERFDELEKFLAGSNEPWAIGQRAIIMDLRSWRDQSLVDAAQAALVAAEAANPDDARLLLHHATSLARRRRKEEALPLFERAIALSPNSLGIRRGYWRTLGKEKQAIAAADIEKYLAGHSSVIVLGAAQRAYTEIGLEEKSLPLQEKILAEFPDSKQAESIMMTHASEYMREHRASFTPETKAEAIRQWRAFVDYPFHYTRETWLASAYATLFSIVKDDGSADDFLDVVDAYLAFGDQKEIAERVAEALATRELRLEQAEKLARIGLRDALVELDRDSAGLTKQKYEDASARLTGNAHSTLGWTLLKRKKIEEAGKHLLTAVKLFPDSPAIQHHLGQYYEATNQLTKADETYTKGMTFERAPSATNAEALRALYVKRHGSDEGWSSYLAAAKEGVSSKKKREILASRVVPARKLAKPFSLKTLDGNEMSFDSLRGKIALIKFWGVWCGPCVSEMPDFQKLVDKYADDPKVVIVTLDSDTDPETPRKFMKKNNYRFPVLLDDGWISRSAGITAYPTTWFVGADGKIAFTKTGVSADLVNEYSWRIDALK